MKGQLCLCDIKPGETAAVCSLLNGGGIRRRLLEMGLGEGARVECLCSRPGNHIACYLVRGAVIALRREDSEKIVVRRCGNDA